ncbi:hypothetical protein M433DRAFT_65302 [Acidomyces richmondensis BFW]|nr:MAG: hypothetical protein FE78DRAFT_145544 [Acidomyces sp. 'richmondensis']KYG46386.1 hypothetical protein M433DRAFT_65302 [Acidomyces richmondensis BFW]
MFEHDEKPAKPKQKRNKPTLSCLECVERKTKCDRGRPLANLIASAGGKNGPNNKARYVTKPPSKIRKTSMASSLTSPVTDNGWATIENRAHRRSISSNGSSPYLLSNVPYSKSSPSNVFGVGSQHPFSNYWTCQGGLPEVISVMPSKEQADILIAKYFEVVDPVYPFLHRRSFYADYERFWALPLEHRGMTDASFVALHYAMYALGTQFMQFPSYEERSQTAEFYCSAANQALRVYSYLNRTSMRAIQAMLLMSYFLMNDNHASDAYAWAGIHLRQAYAMRLHRDPDIVVPEASVLEKQQRRKLWQAVFFHDTFLTVLLKLPPTATHSDVPVESLADDNETSMDGLDTDVTYMRCMWHLGNLVQENLSSPFSLSLPLANSPRHKDSLVAAFKRLYKSFPVHLTTLDYGTLQQQAALHPRAVRQNLFLTSNYYHCMMLLHASENEAAGVAPNIKAALEAAHEAIWAFFKLWGLFENEAGVWWVFQHRAFEESLLIAHLLAIPPPQDANGSRMYDPIYDKGKDDISRMLEIMERYGQRLEVHTERKEVLQEAFSRIVV